MSCKPTDNTVTTTSLLLYIYILPRHSTIIAILINSYYSITYMHTRNNVILSVVFESTILQVYMYMRV